MGEPAREGVAARPLVWELGQGRQRSTPATASQGAGAVERAILGVLDA